jgi:uncharacterized protein (DUF1778 family)
MLATEVINLRISPEQKSLIDYAAQVAGKSRSAFILENSLRCAEEMILDRTRFTLDAAQWEQVAAALDAPLSDEQAEGLRRLFGAQTPWLP